MHDLMTRCKAIVHYKHFDKSLRKVAKIYGVSKSSLQRWVQKDPTIRKPRTNKVVKSEVETCIRRALAANPFQTMTSLADAIQRECGVKMSRSTAGRITRKVGYTRKNARRLVDARHNPEDILSFCRAYQAITGDIICIDEAGFYVGEQGRRGYAPRGVRLRVRSSRTLRRSKYTLIMAVSAQRVVHYQVLDHNCRKADFIRFIDEMPASQGATLVMDNIGFHRSPETVEAIHRKGCKQLRVPPYSPRMNAIENVFGMMKPKYRGKCPPQTDDKFDYRQTFIDVINAPHNFAKYFRRVSAFV